jgi:hypothetical protein
MTDPLPPSAPCGETERKPSRSSMCSPRPAGSLVRAAMAMGARPAIAVTLRESHEVESDMALLRSIVDLLRAYPGEDVLLMRIVTLGGERCSFLWKVEACRELRLALASLLRARAVSGAKWSASKSSRECGARPDASHSDAGVLADVEARTRFSGGGPSAPGSVV